MPIDLIRHKRSKLQAVVIAMPLQRHIPSSSHIDRLPSELLASIFSAAVADVGMLHAATAGTIDATNYQQALIPFTYRLLCMQQIISCSHVCRYWRNAALDYPSLWSIVDLRHDGAEEFVSRSSSSPLRLSIYQAWSYQRAVSKPWLGTHAGRIEEFLLFSPHETMGNILSNLGMSCPRLATVSLTLADTNEWTADVPSFILATPCTRKLSLDHVAVKLDTCAGLTHLHLSWACFDSDPFPISATQFLAFLQRCPLLEVLFLYSLGIHPPDMDDSDVIVKLPCLEQLTISHCRLDRYLLRHLYIPRRAPVICGSDGRNIDRDASSDISDGMLLRFDPFSGTIYFGQNVYRKLIPTSPSRDDDIVPCRKAIPISITPSTPMPNDSSLVCHAAMLGATLDVSAVRKLVIYTPETVLSPYDRPRMSAISAWTTFFTRMPSITTLEVISARGCMEEILLALWPDDSQSLRSRLCPRLIHLLLTFQPFGSKDPEVLFSETKEIANVVVKHLKIRSRSVIEPLSSVTVNFRDDLAIESLRALACNVKLACAALTSSSLINALILPFFVQPKPPHPSLLPCCLLPS
jgi:hypothetical protein